jgi:hypothetical protein
MTFAFHVHKFVHSKGLTAGAEVAWPKHDYSEELDAGDSPVVTQYSTEQEREAAELDWLCRIECLPVSV